jgi:hypothetical protein
MYVQSECSMPSVFYVIQSHRPTFVHYYLKTSVFISYYCRYSFFVSFLFPSSYALFHTIIPQCNCIPLQCLYKGCIQSNQQLALTRLMHSIHCGSNIFSYQALGGRPAQETLLGSAGLHSITNSKTLNIHSV